jgi:hypothetical protein
MATGYVAGAGDLDVLFMARVNAARANVGYQVAGVDLAQRFEQIGGGTPRAAVGFQSGGTDLASLFRAIGDSLVTFPIATMTCTSNMAGSNATARYNLAETGDIMGTAVNNNIVDRGDWISPKTGMTDYEALATVVSGTLTSGVTGSWQSLGTLSRNFSKTATTNGTVSAVFDITIRRISDAVVVAGPTRITLNATREP